MVEHGYIAYDMACAHVKADLFQGRAVASTGPLLRTDFGHPVPKHSVSRACEFCKSMVGVLAVYVLYTWRASILRCNLLWRVFGRAI